MIQLIVTLSMFSSLILPLPLDVPEHRFKQPPAPNYSYGIDYSYGRDAWKDKD